MMKTPTGVSRAVAEKLTRAYKVGHDVGLKGSAPPASALMTQLSTSENRSGTKQKHQGTCFCSSTGRSPMNDEKEPFVRNRNQKTEEAFNALESARKCLSEQEKSDAP